jgi:hypothetical protein
MTTLPAASHGREEGSFGRIARDFTATSALFYALSLIMAWLKSLTGDAAWAAWYGGFLLVLPFIAVYFVGPIYLLVFGFFLKRPGMILPPFLLIAAVIIIPLESRARREAILQSYATINLEPMRERHTMIAFDGTVLICDRDWNCQKRALALSSHQIATRLSPAAPWNVFRRGQHEECQSGDTAGSAAEFLHLGYVGTCAIATSERNLGNALILREYLTPDVSRPWNATYPLQEELAALGLIGHVTEISEQIDGHETMLGRHISGRLASPLPLGLQPYDFFSNRAIDMGPKFDLSALAADALDIPLTEFRRPRPR